jgi:hypothetical protein
MPQADLDRRVAMALEGIAALPASTLGAASALPLVLHALIVAVDIEAGVRGAAAMLLIQVAPHTSPRALLAPWIAHTRPPSSARSGELAGAPWLARALVTLGCTAARDATVAADVAAVLVRRLRTRGGAGQYVGAWLLAYLLPGLPDDEARAAIRAVIGACTDALDMQTVLDLLPVVARDPRAGRDPSIRRMLEATGGGDPSFAAAVLPAFQFDPLGARRVLGMLRDGHVSWAPSDDDAALGIDGAESRREHFVQALLEVSTWAAHPFPQSELSALCAGRDRALREAAIRLLAVPAGIEVALAAC